MENVTDTIGKQISELLFDHDCVIVPSLGGFLASDQPSRIILPNNLIYPPYRRIAFNVYLKQNDGLLANHLVKSDSISYSEAISRINSFTADCFENMGSGKKVSIEQVGLLYYDKEKNIQFEAFRNINHRRDSFGMEAVHFIPITREEKAGQIQKPVVQTIRPSVPNTGMNRRAVIFKKSRKILGVLAVGTALVWFSLNLYLVVPKQYEATSLNPFDSERVVISKADSIRNLPSDSETINSPETLYVGSTEPEPLASTEELFTPEEIIKESPEEIISAADEIIKTAIPEVAQPAPSLPVKGNHFLVAGVFSVPENATSFVARLQQEGFAEAGIISANGKSYVTCGSYSSAAEASEIADSLRRRSLETWVWKH